MIVIHDPERRRTHGPTAVGGTSLRALAALARIRTMREARRRRGRPRPNAPTADHAERLRVTMILENESYPEDSRVRKEAEALVADGLRVTVLAPRRPGQDDAATINGVTVERYWRPTAEHGVRGYLVEYGVAHLQLLPRVLRELVRGTDVIHVHNPPDSLAMLALLGRPFGRKLVYDHHDLAPELFELKFGASPLGSVLRWFQRLSFRAADAVIVTNESQRAVAVAAGADPSNVTVVRNGPSEASIVTRPLARDGVLDDPHIVFVGSLESQDGVLDLPEILDRLRNLPRRANAHLTIVGDGGALREARAGGCRQGAHAARAVHRTSGERSGAGASSQRLMSASIRRHATG